MPRPRRAADRLDVSLRAKFINQKYSSITNAVIFENIKPPMKTKRLHSDRLAKLKQALVFKNDGEYISCSFYM